MATGHRAAHRRRGRTVPQRYAARRSLWIVGGLVLAALLVLAGALVTAGGAPTSELRLATPNAIPNVEPNGRAWGPPDAPIKVEEFVDYQCPACGTYAREHEPQVIDAFAATGKVRYEVHNFAFQGAASRNAAEGALCAAEQNAFWPMHSSIFLNQPRTHGGGSAATFNDDQLTAIAAGLQLNTSTFRQCLTSERYVPQIQRDYDRAVSLKVNATPSFVVNGRLVAGMQSVDDFKRIFATVAPEVQLAP